MSCFLQALLGFKRNITHLDGHVVEIDRAGVTQPGECSEQYVRTLPTRSPGYVQVFEGEGMPLFEQSGHGNLYVEYNVVLPVELSSDMRRSKCPYCLREYIYDSLLRTTELGEAFYGPGGPKRDEL